MKLHFTYFEGGIVASKHGTRHTADVLSFFKRLVVPRETTDKYDVPAFALATFNGPRSLANIESSYALGLDIDDVRDLPQVFAGFARSLAIVYTTWSSTPEAPRARVFVALSRPVNLAEYRIVADWAIDLLSKARHGIDRSACRDAARAWPLPTKKPGGHFDVRISNGAPLDVEPIIAAAPVEEHAVEVRRPLSGSAVEPSTLERARAYLAECDGAISGSGGHRATFIIALKLVRGFGLDIDTAWALLLDEWNHKCQPPWLPRELLHKVRQAANNGQMPEGALRDAPRRAG